MDNSLPEGWMEHRSKAGEVFFHHFDTGITQSNRPTRPDPRQVSVESQQLFSEVGASSRPSSSASAVCLSTAAAATTSFAGGADAAPGDAGAAAGGAGIADDGGDKSLRQHAERKACLDQAFGHMSSQSGAGDKFHVSPNTGAFRRLPSPNTPAAGSICGRTPLLSPESTPDISAPITPLRSQENLERVQVSSSNSGNTYSNIWESRPPAAKQAEQPNPLGSGHNGGDVGRGAKGCENVRNLAAVFEGRGGGRGGGGARGGGGGGGRGGPGVWGIGPGGERASSTSTGGGSHAIEPLEYNMKKVATPLTLPPPPQLSVPQSPPVSPPLSAPTAPSSQASRSYDACIESTSWYSSTASSRQGLRPSPLLPPSSSPPPSRTSPSPSAAETENSQKRLAVLRARNVGATVLRKDVRGSSGVVGAQSGARGARIGGTGAKDGNRTPTGDLRAEKKASKNLAPPTEVAESALPAGSSRSRSTSPNFVEISEKDTHRMAAGPLHGPVEASTLGSNPLLPADRGQDAFVIGPSATATASQRQGHGRQHQGSMRSKAESRPTTAAPKSRLSRARSLSPAAGGGHRQPRPSTSVPATCRGPHPQPLVRPQSSRIDKGAAVGGGGGDGGGSSRRASGCVADSDCAPGYRAFVERSFYRGTGAAQLLNRFKAKAIPELMCHTTAVPKHALLSSTQANYLAEASVGMFRKIQTYMGDVVADEAPVDPGHEGTLRDILTSGRRNFHLACELYCQLIKQTHRCMDAENEERGFVVLACTAFLFPPPTDEVKELLLGHLVVHRTRHCPVGGLALYTHNHVSSTGGDWSPVLETDPLITMSEHVRDCAKNCFVPGAVFGVTLRETLRQEYYAVGVGAVTSPAPPEASASARVPILVQLLVQTIEFLGGVRTEGIFRRPGHAGAKVALKEAISAGDYSVLHRLRDNGKLEKGQLLGDEAFEVDVYTVADTLKSWLRSMKEPLVPAESYDRAVAAGSLEEGNEARQEEAMRVLLALPPPNSATLDFLVRFLSKVAHQEKTNRMNAKGLAVVLSPNLLRNPQGDPMVFKANVNAETDFVKSLIDGSKQ